jgi:adenosylcobinamide-phosphate synthase
VAIDLLFGEPPPRLHPVVWLGGLIDQAERYAPDLEARTSLTYGALATLSLVAASAGVALVCERATAHFPRAIRLIALALLLKPAFALRALLDAGTRVRAALETGDVVSARRALQSLVSRGTNDLSAEECAGASIESLAENSTDSFIGPWLGWMLLGLPGAWAFRAVNTLDSRWGYHGRYEFLGRAAALLDDAIAFGPARLSAIFLIAAAAFAGANPAGGVRVLLRDRALTSSPNAGWTMSAMAGALGRRLTKRGAYTLNASGAACGWSDIAQAQRITSISAVVALVTIAIGGAAAGTRLRRRH